MTRLPISTVVLSNQRQPFAQALQTVRQKIAGDAANPLVHDGQKLIPSVTRMFSASRPLFVFLQAYERGEQTMRPLVAFVTFYRDGVKALETAPVTMRDGWDPITKAVPIRFSIGLRDLPPGATSARSRCSIPKATGRRSGGRRSGSGPRPKAQGPRPKAEGKNIVIVALPYLGPGPFA